MNCHHAGHHNIGCDEYAEIVAHAGDRCQICGIAGKETSRGELVLDHLDEPGHPVPHKIRGMLCDKCNSLMSKVDNRKNWDVHRTNEEAARRYDANAWYLTHPIQPPHRAPDELTVDVKFGFYGWNSNARIHRLSQPWSEHIENRSVCRTRIWFPAHPEVVDLYRPCLACQKKS